MAKLSPWRLFSLALIPQQTILLTLECTKNVEISGFISCKKNILSTFRTFTVKPFQTPENHLYITITIIVSPQSLALPSFPFTSVCMCPTTARLLPGRSRQK